MQIPSSNPFYAAGPMFNSATNPVTITGKDANGNIEGVTAGGVKVSADPTGSMAGFSLADVLTPGDKAATGYDPSSHQINELAIAVATYRVQGFLKGDASPSLISALKTSLAETGSYPANPNMLKAVGAASSASFTYDTLSGLLSAQEHSQS
jgi:hypothetical protein